MSKGKSFKPTIGAPKNIEQKGPVTNPKASSPKAPNMSNKNSGSSPVGSNSTSATNSGMSGTSFDPRIVVESTKGESRNQGSALRGGSNRKSSHSDGNRYGK